MTSRSPIPETLDRIGSEIVDSAFRVHSTLGPGLLESVYEACLAYELRKRKLAVTTRMKVPIVYDGNEIEPPLRLDLVVGDSIIVEVKSAEKHLAVFEAQLLTYLKLSGLRLGYLINFNVPLIREGIKRLAL